jgi:hypothetical protein
MTFTTGYRQNKYKNKKTTFGGRLYGSKLESSVASDLELARHATKDSDRVVDVKPQYNVDIYIDGVTLTTKPTPRKLFRYIPDFFVEYADGHFEIIEAKGYVTDIFRFKWKIFEAVYNKEHPDILLKIIK